MQIKGLSLLNTVTALGADLNISTDGNTYLTGLPFAIPSANIQSVSVQAPVTAVAGVITVTPTAVASTTYTITVSGSNTLSGSLTPVVLSYTTAASGDTATTICDAFRAQLALVRNFSVVGSGTTTLILTGSTTADMGTTPYVSFAVGGSLLDVSATETAATSRTITGSVVAAVTTQSVVGFGSTAILQSKYPVASSAYVSAFGAMSNIVTGATYNEYIISFVDFSPNSSFAQTVNTVQAVVLVRTGVANFDDLCNTTYGTLAGLQAGYRYTIVSPATTTAAVTVTTGAIALAGGSTTLASLGAESGDILVISVTGGASFTTFGTTKITGITGAAAGFGSNIVAISAELFKHVAVRNIPL